MNLRRFRHLAVLICIARNYTKLAIFSYSFKRPLQWFSVLSFRHTVASSGEPAGALNKFGLGPLLSLSLLSSSPHSISSNLSVIISSVFSLLYFSNSVWLLLRVLCMLPIQRSTWFFSLKKIWARQQGAPGIRQPSLYGCYATGDVRPWISSDRVTSLIILYHSATGTCYLRADWLLVTW